MVIFFQAQKCWLKKYTHNTGVVSGLFRDRSKGCSLGNSFSVTERTALKRKEEVQVYM